METWMIAVIVVVALSVVYAVAVARQARKIDARESEQRTGPPD